MVGLLRPGKWIEMGRGGRWPLGCLALCDAAVGSLRASSALLLLSLTVYLLLRHATAPRRWVRVRQELLQTPHGRQRLLAGRPKIHGVPWIDEYVAALQQASGNAAWGQLAVGQFGSSTGPCLPRGSQVCVSGMPAPVRSTAPLMGSPSSSSRRRSTSTASPASTTTLPRSRQQPARQRQPSQSPLPQSWLVLLCRRRLPREMLRRLCHPAPLPPQPRLPPSMPPAASRQLPTLASWQPAQRTAATLSRQRPRLWMLRQTFRMLWSAWAARALGRQFTSPPPPLWQMPPALSLPRLPLLPMPMPSGRVGLRLARGGGCRSSGRLRRASPCLQLRLRLGLGLGMQRAAGLAPLLQPPLRVMSLRSLRSCRWLTLRVLPSCWF